MCEIIGLSLLTHDKVALKDITAVQLSSFKSRLPPLLQEAPLWGLAAQI